MLRRDDLLAVLQFGQALDADPNVPNCIDRFPPDEARYFWRNGINYDLPVRTRYINPTLEGRPLIKKEGRWEIEHSVPINVRK